MLVLLGPIPVLVTRLEDGRLQVRFPSHIQIHLAARGSAQGDRQTVADGASKSALLSNLYRMAGNPGVN